MQGTLNKMYESSDLGLRRIDTIREKETGGFKASLLARQVPLRSEVDLEVEPEAENSQAVLDDLKGDDE